MCGIFENLLELKIGVNVKNYLIQSHPDAEKGKY